MPRRRDVLLGLLVVLICAVFLAPYVIVTVPAGSAGVIWHRFFGGTDTKKVLPEGVALVWPWDKVYLYDTRLQSHSIDIVALTHDGLNVTIALTFRWFVDRNNLGYLHKLIGPDYLKLLLIPEVNASTRREFGKFLTTDYYNAGREVMAREVFTGVVDPGRANFIYARTERDLDRELEQKRPLAEAEIRDRLIEMTDVLVRDIVLPPRIVGAIQSKIEQEQLVKEMRFRVEREQYESERKVVEAKGIKQFQEIVQSGISEPYLKWRGIEATVMLATSPNAKTVVIGGNGGLPLILNTGDAATPPSSPLSNSPLPGSTPPAPGPQARAPQGPAAAASDAPPLDGANAYEGSVDVSRPDLRSQQPSPYSLGAPLPAPKGAWSHDLTLGLRAIPPTDPDAPALRQSGPQAVPAPVSAGGIPLLSSPAGAGGGGTFWTRMRDLLSYTGWFGGPGEAKGEVPNR
ncbi:prohibitin family protein [Methylobacterium sp. EM32]|uniref:prohibitin family protein n=1 Tax=Methylobacterium sp. EM32 TaxID=3163481 RepID=UPI0033B6F7DD